MTRFRLQRWFDGWGRSLLVLSLIAVAAGCQKSGEKLVEVQGKVSYKGQPLVVGLVNFQPVEDGTLPKRRLAVGVIGADGVYRMSSFKSGDGIRPGEYIVSVDGGLSKATGPVALEDPSPARTEADKQLDKFRNPITSGLKATVPADKDSAEIDFHLEG